MSTYDGKANVTQEDYCDNENDDDNCDSEAMTCDALCRLSDDHAKQPAPCGLPCSDDDDSDHPSSNKAKRKSPEGGMSMCCPKQLQLPMFLSSKSEMQDLVQLTIVYFVRDLELALLHYFFCLLYDR